MTASIKTFLLVAILILAMFINLPAKEIFTSQETTTVFTPERFTIVESTCSKKELTCEGQCTWSDGSSYEGEFQNGLPHGYGEQTWLDGSYYEGTFINGFRSGKGTQILDNGDQYIGHFEKGMMSGRGTYIWANGTVYNGEYQKDKLQGFGHIQFTNGASYEGNWKNGKANGEGVFITAGGARFAGTYKKGKRHGKGVMTWNTGAMLTGNWYNGFLVKEGLFKFQDGDGFWANWKLGKHDGKVKYNHATTKKFITVKYKDLMNQLNAKEKANMAIVHYFMAIEFQLDKNYNNAITHLESALRLLNENDIRYDAINLELTATKEKAK